MVLFGILYCSSNKELKVNKFYELCQINLDPYIASSDKELVELIPKLLEISYDLALAVYKKHKTINDDDLDESLIIPDGTK